MRIIALAWLSLIPLAVTPLGWSQADNSQSQESSSDNTQDLMVTPPPVSTQAYPTSYASETRSNYITGGLTFSPGYSDNVFAGGSGRPVTDVNYSVWPSIALDETRPRLHWLMSYAPGFTLYQHTSGLNQATQNVALDLQYRLSPRFTLTIVDHFLKSSNVLDQQTFTPSTSVSGSTQTQGQTVIAPFANQLDNTGSVQLTYQFRPNAMIGASGNFTNLHYTNPTQVIGLYDSSSKAGSLFYTHRLSGKHYLGVTYQYQDMLTFPPKTQTEAQVHSLFLFYTVYFNPALSLSLFGGPQYSDEESTVRPSGSWSPAAGISMSWQGRQTSVSISCSRMVTSGNGLIESVHQDAANLSLRRQLTRMLGVTAAGGYTDNKILDPGIFFNGLNVGGHTEFGTLSMHRQWGQHFSASLGYTRLYQAYADIVTTTSTPNVNREWVSISYQLSRPVGR